MGTRPESFRRDVAKTAQQSFDEKGWEWLLDASGMSSLMTANDKRKLRNELKTDLLSLTRESVHASFIELFGNRHEIFRGGVVELFRSLCRQYRSHDPFKAGKRLILPGAFRDYTWNSFSSAEDHVNDLERVLYLLEHQEPTAIPLEQRLTRRIHAAHREGQYSMITKWLDCRWFANGNLHIWLRMPGHIDQINALIAEEYGASLAYAPNRGASYAA